MSINTKNYWQQKYVVNNNKGKINPFAFIINKVRKNFLTKRNFEILENIKVLKSKFHSFSKEEWKYIVCNLGSCKLLKKIKY